MENAKKTIKTFLKAYKKLWKEDGYDIGWFLGVEDLNKVEHWEIITKAVKYCLKILDDMAEDEDFLLEIY